MQVPYSVAHAGGLEWSNSAYGHPFPYDVHHTYEAWLGIPLESRRLLGGPESEFPLLIPEFWKLASENCAKIHGGKVIN